MLSDVEGKTTEGHTACPAPVLGLPGRQAIARPWKSLGLRFPGAGWRRRLGLSANRVTNAIKCLVRSLCLTGNNDTDYKETFQHSPLFPRLILVGMTLIKLMHGIIFDKVHTACGIMLSWLRLSLGSPHPFLFSSFFKTFFFFSICQLNCIRNLSRRLCTWNRKKKLLC